MSEHFIIICGYCGTTINQCRCISKDKETIYSICEKCKKTKPKLIKQLKQNLRYLEDLEK